MIKPLLVIVSFLIVVGVLTGVAAYKYDNRPKTVATTVSIDKYNQVIEVTKTHDAVNNKNVLILQSQIDKLTQQRAVLCTNFKAAKVVVPATLCQ